MNVKDAFFATAALFEKQPKRYVWNHASVPTANTEKSTGCILAWVGFFIGGMPDNATSAVVAKEVLGMNEIDFYFKLLQILEDPKRGLWCDNAAHVAKGIRKYAEKYL